MIFADRSEAGRRLAAVLAHLRERHPVVLALPRGGVPVAAEVAAVLHAPLDLVLVRKIGVPQQPELAAGAVVDGERAEIVLNEDVVALAHVPRAYIDEAAARELREIERRRTLYTAGRRHATVTGRTAIVIDDGIATGATMRAALRAVRRQQPARLVLAVPVAPEETIDRLRDEVDEVVCLDTPSPFGAIGAFYDDFRQVDDDEVRRLLDQAAAAAPPASGPA